MLLISFLINKKCNRSTSVNRIHTHRFQRTYVTSSILYRFHPNPQKAYKSSFEKSLSLYVNFPFSVLLKQWQISKQLNSLIEVHYAQIKRNPE